MLRSPMSENRTCMGLPWESFQIGTRQVGYHCFVPLWDRWSDERGPLTTTCFFFPKEGPLLAIPGYYRRPKANRTGSAIDVHTRYLKRGNVVIDAGRNRHPEEPRTDMDQSEKPRAERSHPTLQLQPLGSECGN